MRARARLGGTAVYSQSLSLPSVKKLCEESGAATSAYCVPDVECVTSLFSSRRCRCQVTRRCPVVPCEGGLEVPSPIPPRCTSWISVIASLWSHGGLS